MSKHRKFLKEKYYGKYIGDNQCFANLKELHKELEQDNAYILIRDCYFVEFAEDNKALGITNYFATEQGLIEHESRSRYPYEKLTDRIYYLNIAKVITWF